jgi:pilus assembly protein CpaC
MRRWLWILTATLALAAASAGPVSAQTSEIRIDVSTGQMIQLRAPAGNVFVADPAVADVQVPTPRTVFVFGKRIGQTTLFALTAEGTTLASYRIVVSQDLTELRRAIDQEAGGALVEVQATPNGVTVSGVVEDAAAVERIRSITAAHLGEKQSIINRLKVAAPQQINLRVRVAEVARSVSKEFGFNWDTGLSAGSFLIGFASGRSIIDPTSGRFLRSPTGAGSVGVGLRAHRTNLNNLVDALAEEGLVTVLAEPNLTAISGETATFLAGGEFPIPVAQYRDQISIQFKKFGISLDFIPTVISADRISIKVRPEVSELSDQGAIELQGFRIPGLTVRRAETTVELGSGESFAIAGLLQNNINAAMSKVPGLGDIPILGALFRSNRFRRQETELVIIVTPYVVRPAAAAGSFQMPTDGLVPANDVERIFQGHLLKSQPNAPIANPLGVNGVRLHGNAGFIVQ